MQNHRHALVRLLAIAALVAAVLIPAYAFWTRAGEPDDRSPPVETPTEIPVEPPTEPPDEAAQIRKLCSTCHALPDPGILPWSMWRAQVEKMYEFAGADKEVTEIPPIESTLRYFLRAAPMAIASPAKYAGRGPGPLRFEPRGERAAGLPAVSYLTHVRFLDDRRKDLIVCDMRSGEVRLHEPARTLARLAHPCHVEVVDLDGDGRRDLLVAELGSFSPEDHRHGKALWLRGRPDRSLETIPLLENVGRVADVQAADYDADGDLDVAIAVFGWRQTGKLVVLENEGPDERGLPVFQDYELDPRPGAINVPFVDLDGDGKLDLVVLFSQQYETVEAYLNDGAGWFKRKTIYEAPHPDWGTDGIEVVDLDADGDLDVLLVAGDTLDTVILKPHQGVFWLENRGSFPFHAQRLAPLAGAHKVRAADLDGDGDLDLAASAFLPQQRAGGAPEPSGLGSVLWIEQTSPGQFQPHPLELVTCDHPALEVGDFDGDGDIDIVVGNFLLAAPPEGVGALTFFTNLGAR